jgi:uncharacterized protein YndB with AHSA1/START domain
MVEAPHTGHTSITIHAPADKVWNALTDAGIIEQWLHGTHVETNWKINSPITYRGEWEGKTYEDKGTIIEMEAPKRFRATYWSAFSGLDDRPENYSVVSYEIKEEAGATKLTLTQSNTPTEEDAKNVAKNWSSPLQKLKELLEKK